LSKRPRLYQNCSAIGGGGGGGEGGGGEEEEEEEEDEMPAGVCGPDGCH